MSSEYFLPIYNENNCTVEGGHFTNVVKYFSIKRSKSYIFFFTSNPLDLNSISAQKYKQICRTQWTLALISTFEVHQNFSIS